MSSLVDKKNSEWTREKVKGKILNWTQTVELDDLIFWVIFSEIFF